VSKSGIRWVRGLSGLLFTIFTDDVDLHSVVSGALVVDQVDTCPSGIAEAFDVVGGDFAVGDDLVGLDIFVSASEYFLSVEFEEVVHSSVADSITILPYGSESPFWEWGITRAYFVLFLCLRGRKKAQ